MAQINIATSLNHKGEPVALRIREYLPVNKFVQNSCKYLHDFRKTFPQPNYQIFKTMKYIFIRILKPH